MLFLELGDVNAGLRSLVAPVVLGEAAAVAHLRSGSRRGLPAPLEPAVVAVTVTPALVLGSAERKPAPVTETSQLSV